MRQVAGIVAGDFLDVADTLAKVSVQIFSVLALLLTDGLALASVLVESGTWVAKEATGVQSELALASRTVPLVAEFSALQDVLAEVFAHADGFHESLIGTALQLTSRVARAGVLIDGVEFWALQQAGGRALAIVKVQGVELWALKFASRFALAPVDVGLVPSRAGDIASRFASAKFTVDLEVVGATKEAGGDTVANTDVGFFKWMWALNVTSIFANTGVNVKHFPVWEPAGSVTGVLALAHVDVGLLKWMWALDVTEVVAGAGVDVGSLP